MSAPSYLGAETWLQELTHTLLVWKLGQSNLASNSPEITTVSFSWLHRSELNINKSPFHFKAQTFANKLDEIQIHNIELISILLDK